MAIPTEYADIQSDVDDLVGADLTSSERDRFIHEGYVELCVQSGFSKALLSIGPAVSGTETYAATSARKVLEVAVAGYPYGNSDLESVRQAKLGRLGLRGDGVWWWNYDSAGAVKVGIYPVRDGGAIEAFCVVEPDPMSADDDEPIVPTDFRGAIVDYVGAVGLGRGEDNADLRAGYRAEFDRQVQRLTALVNERESGSGPIQMGVAGIHF